MLLPALHHVQHAYNWIPPQAMEEIAAFLELAPAEVMDTATFYEEYWLRPKGKYLIQVCRSLSCEICRSETHASACSDKLGVEVGETTPDGRFTLVELECLGACGTAPVARINEVLLENLTPRSARSRDRRAAGGSAPLQGPGVTWDGTDDGPMTKPDRQSETNRQITGRRPTRRGSGAAPLQAMDASRLSIRISPSHARSLCRVPARRIPSPLASCTIAGVTAWSLFFKTYHLATVQKNVLYRDGCQKPGEFANAINRVKPRTVVSLIDDRELNDPKKPQFKMEEKLLRLHGIRLERIPVKLGGWPTKEDVERFMAITQDPDEPAGAGPLCPGRPPDGDDGRRLPGGGHGDGRREGQAEPDDVRPQRADGERRQTVHRRV